MRIYPAFLFVMLLFSGCIQPLTESTTGTAPTTTAGAQPAAEILWDTWGIPHIFAEDEAGGFYALGWAQMHNHGNLLLQLYAQGRGQAAQYFGEAYRQSDHGVRLLGIPTLGKRWYGEQSPTFQAYLDAFAAGINDYAAQHPDALSAEARAVLPVNGTDVVAHTTRVMATFISATSECGSLLPGLDFIDEPSASNGWALAPAYSASGNAMLLANPHLAWYGFHTFFEAHLSLPDLNLYGATLVGFPVHLIAFNDYLGWTHTTNTIDGCDSYHLTLAGETVDDGYILDGTAQPFTVVTQTVAIRQADGTLLEEALVLRRSQHGPVVAVDGQHIALRMAMLEVSPIAGLNEQWWAMGRARNLEAFERALARLQLPTQMVIYADRAGHIMSLFNGLVPVRPTGDFQFWFNPVPGDDATLIWSTVHPYGELPKVIDPPSGWVQNSNSPPWYTTLPMLDSARYAPYIAPPLINTREQQGIKLLTEQAQMTFEQMVAAKYSTHSLVADQLLDELIAAARTDDRTALRQATAVLAAWDRSFDAESRGAALFTFWFQTYVQGAVAQAQQINPSMTIQPDLLVSDLVYAQPFDPAAPLTTPRGLADEALALTALARATEQLQAQVGALDVPWGEVARLRWGDFDFPGNGTDGSLGVFRVIGFQPGQDGRLASNLGDSFIAAVEFADPVRAQVLVTYGNASQPNTFPIGDQLQLAANKQLRPAWLTRAEIEANLALREELVPPASR